MRRQGEYSKDPGMLQRPTSEWIQPMFWTRAAQVAGVVLWVATLILQLSALAYRECPERGQFRLLSTT
jgi:hypothetical protein